MQALTMAWSCGAVFWVRYLSFTMPLSPKRLSWLKKKDLPLCSV